MDFKDQKKDIAEDAFLWEVEATDDAEQDIDNFVFYLLMKKRLDQSHQTKD